MPQVLQAFGSSTTQSARSSPAHRLSCARAQPHATDPLERKLPRHLQRVRYCSSGWLTVNQWTSATLRFLGTRHPRVESYTDGIYRRTIRLPHGYGLVSSPHPTQLDGRLNGMRQPEAQLKSSHKPERRQRCYGQGDGSTGYVRNAVPWDQRDLVTAVARLRRLLDLDAARGPWSAVGISTAPPHTTALDCAPRRNRAARDDRACHRGQQIWWQGHGL